MRRKGAPHTVCSQYVIQCVFGWHSHCQVMTCNDLQTYSMQYFTFVCKLCLLSIQVVVPNMGYLLVHILHYPLFHVVHLFHYITHKSNWTRASSVRGSFVKMLGLNINMDHLRYGFGSIRTSSFISARDKNILN
jgi:hypothetical protein